MARLLVVRWLLLATFAPIGAGCPWPAASANDLPPPAPDDYFPAATWRTSPPEAQGIDSDILVEMMNVIATRRLAIHSLQIVRHGHLVLDVYFHPFQSGDRHDIASITKSVTTTLVGLALERGAIEDLEVPVYPLLSSSPPADARKLQIRLRHLMTHTSGLDCSPEPYEREMLAMVASDDWVRFALDLPIRETPGRRFVYCSPVFHVLSALVTHATGLSAQDFARVALFAPIGVSDWRWPNDPQGISLGSGDLQMRPTDLLRLGYLFLRRGNWSGRQLISEDWIDQATRAQVDTPTSERYGFGWWISTEFPGIVQGVGRGGQRLIVWPDRDMVVVTTGGGFDPGQIAPYLLRALRGDAALAPNPEGHEALMKRVREAGRTAWIDRVAPSLPPRATLISGVDFELESNPLGMRGMQLQFNNDALGQVRFRLRDSELLVPLGLDGVYRMGIDPVSGNRVAGRGQWTNPDQFVLQIDTIARISHFTISLDFVDDAFKGRVREGSGLVQGIVLSGRSKR